VGGVAERDPVRPAPHGRAPAPAALSPIPARSRRLPRGVGSAIHATWRPYGTAGGHWRAAPTLESPD
jgi:hypothetical protein